MFHLLANSYNYFNGFSRAYGSAQGPGAVSYTHLMLTFLRMFGVGKAEHLNVLTRWKEHDPTRTLATEVGVDENGNLFTLDLHEKFHGDVYKRQV